MNTWQDTAEALAVLYKTAAASGFVVDRAGICLDRRMGLPAKQRRKRYGKPTYLRPSITT
jgi:hypothetical protein